MATALEEKWAQPHEVDDVTLAFSANVASMMPSREECDEALRAMPDRGRGWLRFQSDWFFHGISPKKLKPRKDVDKTKALRHLGAIQGSFEPKHEHKEVAVAFLASLWFKKPSYERGGSNG